MAAGRAYSGNRTVLQLDEDFAAIKSIEGGPAKAALVTIEQGASMLPMYTISGIEEGEISFDQPFAQRGKMLEWLNAFIDNKHMYKDGAFAWGDADGLAKGSLEFRQALMTEFTIPALDANGKDALFVTVKCKPTQTALLEGDDTQLGGVSDEKQKFATNANFRLTISGIEGACKKAIKVDSLSWKMKAKTAPVGELRVAELVATKLEAPKLKVTFGREVLSEVSKKYHDFVFNGQVGAGAEMNGSIEILAQNTKDVIMTIQMTGMGFTELKLPKVEANKDDAAQFTCEWYVTNFDLKG